MAFNAIKANEIRESKWSEETDKQMIVKILPKNRFKKYDIVLDVGCGGGQLTCLLDSEITVGHIYGIDISEDVIEFAKQNHMKDNITYIAQDFGVEFDCLTPELKALEGQVSLIISNSVFSQIPDLKNISNNLYRLLSNGGTVCASVIQIRDLYVDLTPEEKAIHEKEVMKIQDQRKVVNDMLNVFKSVGFHVIYDEKYDHKVFMAFNAYKLNLVSLKWRYGKSLISSDEETIEAVMRQLKDKEIEIARHFTNETTGEAMVEYNVPYIVFRIRK